MNGYCWCPNQYTGQYCESCKLIIELIIDIFLISLRLAFLVIGCKAGDCWACANGGTCANDGTCICRFGYTGTQCQTCIYQFNFFLYEVDHQKIYIR